MVQKWNEALQHPRKWIEKRKNLKAFGDEILHSSNVCTNVIRKTHLNENKLFQNADLKKKTKTEESYLQLN